MMGLTSIASDRAAHYSSYHRLVTSLQQDMSVKKGSGKQRPQPLRMQKIKNIQQRVFAGRHRPNY